MTEIYVLRPWDTPQGDVANVTSKSRQTFKNLSPFAQQIVPLPLYGGYACWHMENGWQYSKVYAQYNAGGYPTDEYFDWAQNGWSKMGWADRYPMGKGVIPQYSWWDGEALGYIEARKQIYVPLYRASLKENPFFDSLVRFAKTRDVITIQDYDAYDHRSLGMTLQDVLNNPKRKMGHGFVLAMMLEEILHA